MEWYEILLIVFAAAFVIGVAVWQIVRKKKGKGGPDCGCANCSGCAGCGAKPKRTDKQ